MTPLPRQRTLTFLSAIALALLYLWLISPGKVVVDVNGTIDGMQNDIREKLQAQRFWSTQYELAVRERDSLLGQPERERKILQEIERIGNEVDASLERVYRDNPGLRPSVPSSRAKELRDAADRIEQADLDRVLDGFRRKRIGELSRIISICDERRQ